MADDIDRASEQFNHWLSRQVEALRQEANQQDPGTGLCLNCLSEVPDGHKFCDEHCRDDWQYRKNLEARLGRR